MENINFTLAYADSSKRIKGVFTHVEKQGGTITLQSNFNGEWKFDVTQSSKINHPGNFLASFFRKVDVENVLDRVIVNRKGTKIIRDVPKTEFQAIQLNDHAFTPEALEGASVTITDVNGKDISISVTELMGAKKQAVTLPIDGKYTKNPFINQVLWDNQVEFSLAKNVTSRISDLYGTLRDYFNENTDAKAYHILMYNELKTVICETYREDKLKHEMQRYNHKKDLKVITITREIVEANS